MTRANTGLGYWLLPFGILILAYFPVLHDLISDWYHDDNYSHGFLVPLVSAYLIWSCREELARLPITRGGIGLFVIVLGQLLFLLGTGSAEYFTARLSFVLTLFGLTWYLFGNSVIRKIWFAFFFLCFMIPVPYVIYFAIAVPLQLFATKVTAVALNLIGMEIVGQGNIIHLAGGYSLEVVDACSGIRSLVSLLALGAIFAYWSQKRLAGQLLLFLSTIPIAVLANIFRVFITAILASAITGNVTEEPLHTALGLSVFAVAFICLSVTSLILRKLLR